MDLPAGEWFERYRSTRDSEALTRALDLVLPALRDSARAVARDAHHADDLVHDTLLVALEKADSFDPGRPLLPWLRGILRLQARALHRPSRPCDLDSAGPARDSDPAGALEQQEWQRSLRDTLGAMPDPYRTVLTLRLVHELEPAAIAAHLQRPVGTVRNQIRRGADVLRRVLPPSLLPMLLAALAAPALGAGPPSGSTRLRFSRGRRMAAGVLASCLVLGSFFAWLALPSGVDSVEADVLAPAARASTAALPVALPEEVPSKIRRVAAADAPSAPQSTGVVDVRVLDAEGDPLPHVGVYVRARRGVDKTLGDYTAVTGADGIATLANLSPGGHSLLFDRGKTIDIDVPVDARTEIEVRLDQGFEVVAEVVDDNGAPVAGATVWFSKAPAVNHDGHIVCRSDAEGRFVLRDVQHRNSLMVYAAGHAPSGTYELTGPVGGTDPLRIVLRRGGAALALCVTDEAGDPLEGVRVEVGMRARTAVRYGRYVRPAARPGRLLVTDASGRVRAEGLDAGATEVTLRHSRFALTALRLEATANPIEQCVTLQPGRELEIRVTAAGRPLPRAELTVEEGSRLRRWQAFTDDDGWARLTGVGSGALAIRAGCAGHSPAYVAVPADTTASRRVTLDLPPELEVRGRLVDASGESVVGALVGLAAHEPFEREPRARETLTGSDGSFALQAPSNRTFRVAVREAGQPIWYYDDRVGPVCAGGEPLQLVLPPELQATSVLRAELIDHDGRAPAPTQLLAIRRSDGETFAMAVAPQPGRVELRLPPDRYRVLAFEQRRSGFVDLGEHELAPRETLDLGRVVAAAPGVVRCRFERRDGGPLRDIWAIVCESSGQPLQRIPLGPDGVGELAVPPGKYTLAVVGGSIRWIEGESFEVASLSPTDLHHVLAPAAQRELRILLPSRTGSALRELSFELLGPDGRVVLAKERVVVGDVLPVSHVLPAGSYEVRVTEGESVHTARFAVPQEPVTEIDVSLR